MSSNRSLLQRAILIVSGLAFLSTTVFFAASTFMAGNNPSDHNSGAVTEASPGSEAEQAQLEDQEAGFASVLENEPDNFAALEGLARTRIQLGELDAALEPLEKLAEQDPENAGVWQAIAAIQLQRQDFEAALEPLDRLIELVPEGDAQLEEMKALRAQIEQQLAGGGTSEAPAAAPASPDSPEPEAESDAAAPAEE